MGTSVNNEVNFVICVQSILVQCLSVEANNPGFEQYCLQKSYLSKSEEIMLKLGQSVPCQLS